MSDLLIECSSGKIEFGFAEKDEIVFSKVMDESENADNLVYNIRNAFDENNISIQKIQNVCLSNGPGSFTGLRIGSAIAKGICLSLGSRLIELPTLDIIANKLKNTNNITSIVFSNTRTMEFHYCRYKIENGKLNRISEYMTGLIEDIILNTDEAYIINENAAGKIPDKFKELIIDVSGQSGILSMLELSIEAKSKNAFTDFRTSEPFYMNEFVPKI